jgi:hypothetical protein
MPIDLTYVPPKRTMREFPVITPGTYKAKITDIELKKDQPKFNKPEELEDRYNFKFEILEGQFAGETVLKNTSVSMNAGYKGQPSGLFSLFCAAYSCVLTDEEAQSVSVADINSLIGKEVIVSIVNKPSADGKRTFNNIKDIFPASMGSSKGWEQIKDELPSQSLAEQQKAKEQSELPPFDDSEVPEERPARF